jgi:hypothetical protein
MDPRVVLMPCLTVARPHRREAFRALLGQGVPRDALTDDLLDRLLWLGRALPAVLDLLDDGSLDSVRLSAASVELLGRPPERGPLALLAWHDADDAFVEVLVLAPEALQRRAFDAAFVRMGFPVGREDGSRDDDDDGEPTVRLQRFTLG